MKFFRTLILVFMALPVHGAASGRPDDSVRYVKLAGKDPASRAIIDSTGKFTKRYLKDAASVKPISFYGRRWHDVKFHTERDKESQTCQIRSAEIHRLQTGYMIDERLSFYKATKDPFGRWECARDKIVEISAPTLSHFLASEWAVGEIRKAVAQPPEEGKDPIWFKGSFVKCPTVAERAKRIAAYEVDYVASCKSSQHSCVRLRMSFREEFPEGGGSFIEIVEFEVDYESGRKRGSFALKSLRHYPGYLMPPAMAGPPKIIG